MSLPHDIPSAFAVLFRAVLQASWQGSLAIALVLLVRRVLGTRVPARWHYLLWFLVLARLLVPTMVLPHSPASLENIPALAHPFERPPAALPPDAIAVDPGLFSPVPTAPARSSVRGIAPAPEARSVSPGKTRSPWIWAAWVWLGGVLLLAGWLVACVIRLRGRLSHETTPAEESILAVWRACCQRWLWQTPPPLRVADWVDSPALVGWWRPTLLISRQSLATFSAQDWEHVFAHEIAHLRWRDHWSQLLLLAAWCVHWFNPVVWLGLRRLRADRELAADEWVLRHLRSERALAYGETLFKTLAGRSPGFAFNPGMVGISEDGAQMKQRLSRIAAFLPQRRVYGSLLGFAVALGLGTVVLGQGSPGTTATPPAKAAVQPPVTPDATSIESLAAESRKLSAELLAAARAGDAAGISRLLEFTYQSSEKPGSPPPPKFSEEAATGMLDDLVRQRELTAFTVLHDQLKQTSYAKDWKPDDGLLAGLVRDGRTDFLEALLARRLDLDRLRALISSTDQPTADWIARRVAEVAKQRADLEALEKAAEDNDLPALQRLVDAGADVNGVGTDDNTPLIRAVFRNRLEAAQWLLDHGAQVDKARHPYSTYTPLCLVNSVPMAELLKKNGANVHAQLAKDVSILTYVAKHAPFKVVEWFLQQGLDAKMIDDDGKTLLFGLENGQTAEQLLNAGLDPNYLDKYGETPIFSARSAEVARALIDHGAKVSGFKEPLLPRLAQTGSAGALEAVIQAGADHDFATLQQALLGAVSVDDGETVKMLIAHGAKPNEPSVNGPGEDDKWWPLTACTMEGQSRAAKALLEAGADPNGGKKPGWLLINAMFNGQKEVAQLLHDAGARNVSDLSYAVFMRDAARIKTLLASAPGYAENPAFWDYVLPIAAQVGDLDTVRTALAKGAPPRPDDDADAYASAAFAGQDEALASLLAARKPGDDPASLREALMEAVYNSHPYKQQRTAEHFEKCVQMLLDAGAPVNGGKVPLVQGATFTRNPGGNPIVIETLVRAGADPNPPVPSEANPLARLLDAVQQPDATRSLSAQVVETLVRLNHLVSPTPQASADKAETPPAMFGHEISTTGTVSMADGTPLDGEEIVATAYSFRGTGGFMVSPQRAENGLFPLYLDEHTTRVTVAVAQKGCAVVFVGPFDAGNMDQLNDLHVKLTHGYTAVVNVVDAAGHPVAGARLRPYYACPSNAELPREETTTDASGSAAIEHVGEAPLNIRVLADGFQADEATGLRLDPAKPYRWTLKKVQPRRGIVTDASTGKPISGAVIKLAGVRGPRNETSYDPKKAPVLTTADAQGHFTLGSLRPDSRYYLFVEAPGHGGAFLRGVRLTPDELSVVLGPELFVRGKITHAPPSVIHMDKVYLRYGQTFEFEDNSSGMATATAYLRPVNGEADFTVGPFYKVSGEPIDPKMAPAPMKPQAQIYVDSWADAEFNIDDLPISDFVFDLAQKTNDRSAPEPAAPAKQATTEGKATPKAEPSSTAAPLPPPPEAHSTVSKPAPKPEIIEIHPTGEVPPSNAQATASLSGVVTAATNGQPVAGAEVRLVGKTELIAAKQYGLRVAANGTTTTDGQGRFTLSNLRANAVYQLCVEAQGYGAAYVAVDKLPLDEFQVKLGPERFIHGRIIHAPASLIHGGQLSLSFSQSLGEDRPEKEVWKIVILQPKDGSSDFVIGPFYLSQGVQPFSKAPVSLRVDGKDLAYFRGEDLPDTDYVLDLAPDLGPLGGEYKVSPDSLWTLDLRSDGTAFYYSRSGRYTARYSLAEKVVTFTFPDGLQEHLQVDGSQLMGMPGNQVLPTFERLKPGGGLLDGEYKTSAASVWTLDLRSNGTGYYYSDSERYTARYILAGDIVTFTFGDGKQERLQRGDSQLLGMPENKILPASERLKKQ